MTTPVPTAVQFFSKLRWIDGRPLLRQFTATPLPGVIEPYREKIFHEALDSRDAQGHPQYNLVLCGRAKKNWKSADLVLAALYRLFAWDSPGGNQCYLLANDEDQARDDLELAIKIIRANPILRNACRITKNRIERKDGRGFLEILPAKDIAGTHGKTYCFTGFDEIHGYRDWALLEAMQLDPTRPDAMIWITSYASLFHKPGVPLFDLMARGKAGTDPRMYFSWFGADYVSDPAHATETPEERANPSRGTFTPGYLAQQEGRLPAHKYRRLHLNLPGLPEGSAFSAEMVMAAVDRMRRAWLFEPGMRCSAFVDMSGGSSDDATLAIGYLDRDGKAIVCGVWNQGQPPPFDPRLAIARFVAVLKQYQVCSVVGDAYAGLTFAADFGSHGIAYRVADRPKSQLYESLEPALNSGRVVLPNIPEVEQQLLGLVWRGNKIDHANGERDDFANAASGLVHLLLGSGHTTGEAVVLAGGERVSGRENLERKVGPVLESWEERSIRSWQQVVDGPGGAGVTSRPGVPKGLII